MYYNESNQNEMWVNIQWVLIQSQTTINSSTYSIYTYTQVPLVIDMLKNYWSIGTNKNYNSSTAATILENIPRTVAYKTPLENGAVGGLYTSGYC